MDVTSEGEEAMATFTRPRFLLYHFLLDFKASPLMGLRQSLRFVKHALARPVEGDGVASARKEGGSGEEDRSRYVDAARRVTPVV